MPRTTIDLDCCRPPRAEAALTCAGDDDGADSPRSYSHTHSSNESRGGAPGVGAPMASGSLMGCPHRPAVTSRHSTAPSTADELDPRCERAVVRIGRDQPFPFPRDRVFSNWLARGPDLIYLFWPTAMAYLRIATDSSIFGEPSRPSSVRGGEHRRDWSISRTSRRPVSRSHFCGLSWSRGSRPRRAWPVIFCRTRTSSRSCARTVCGRIWTNDRDFRRFEGNPRLGIRSPELF